MVLTERSEVLHDVLDALPDATVVARAVALGDEVIDLEIVWMNATAREEMGDLVDAGALASAHWPWAHGLTEACLEVLASGEEDAGEVVWTDEHGEPQGFDWRATKVEPDLLLWVQRNIQAPLRERHHLATAEARLRAALAQSFDGHAFFHPGREGWEVTWANDEYRRLDEDGKLSADLTPMVQRVHDSQRRLSELVPVAGQIFEVRLYPVEHEIAVTVADQTEMFSTTAGLVWDVLHDPLTGIGNRTKLRQDLASALTKGGAATVLCLDLDGFKDVNDTHGHAAGDEVLRQVADRISSALREGEEAYRLGGDEFVVLAAPLGEAAARALGERIAALVVEPIAVGEAEVAVDVSIGVTVGTASEPSPAIIARGDAALYEAKRSRSRVVFS